MATGDETQQVINTAELLSWITVDQFYGIEIGEFSVRIAETALWMMDHIMNNRLSLAFGQSYARIPLEGSPHILHADALEMNWADFLPPQECSYVIRQSTFRRCEESKHKAARSSSPDRLSGQGGWNSRLCDCLVPQGRRICSKRFSSDRLRCHQLDHPGRAGGTTLAASVRAISAGNRLRAPHLCLGIGCTWQGPCACGHSRAQSPGERSSRQATVQLSRHQW